MSGRRKSPLDELKQLRRRVKDHDADETAFAERMSQQRRYAHDLNEKLNEALKRLRMISTATYFEIESSLTDDTVLRMKKTAAYGLEKISKMSNREPA